MPLPMWAIGAGVGLAGGVLSNVWSAREASKNREFQREMSDTAVHRRAADLRAAGINPLLAGRFEASSPSGATANISDVGRGMQEGVNSGLAIQRQKAEIDLLKRQADQSAATTAEINRSSQEANSGSAWRLSVLQSEDRLRSMSVDQRREMFQEELRKIRQEVSLSVATAKRTEVLTSLDKLAKQGMLNEAQFQEMIGTAGPALQWLYRAAQLFNLATGDPVRRIP